MTESSPDLSQVLAHIKTTIGDADCWVRWPGGWPDDIEAALVDAVFSARAVYRSKHGRGIYGSVVAWRASRDRTVYSLDALVGEIDAVGVPGWARQFGNHQNSPHRPATAPGGRLKAATVRQAACALRSYGITGDIRIDLSNVEGVKRELRGVPGIGYATANYFLMLLGAPGVKPDRMVHRFLKEATGEVFTNAEAEQAIWAAAQQLNRQPHELDHAIWSFESARARR